MANATNEHNKRCASQKTYAAIQSELFRQAAETRGSDEAAFGQISDYSIVRMEQPVVRSFDEELATLRCSGKLVLQLPRGIAVVGGRHALAAEVDYVLQAAADGTGDVVMLEGAAPITIPLATLARSESYSDLVATRSPAPSKVAAAPVPLAPAPVLRPTSAVDCRRAHRCAPAQPVRPPRERRPSPSRLRPLKTEARVRERQAELQLSLCADPGRNLGMPRRGAGVARPAHGEQLLSCGRLGQCQSARGAADQPQRIPAQTRPVHQPVVQLSRLRTRNASERSAHIMTR